MHPWYPGLSAQIFMNVPGLGCARHGFRAVRAMSGQWRYEGLGERMQFGKCGQGWWAVTQEGHKVINRKLDLRKQASSQLTD